MVDDYWIRWVRHGLMLETKFGKDLDGSWNSLALTAYFERHIQQKKGHEPRQGGEKCQEHKLWEMSSVMGRSDGWQGPDLKGWYIKEWTRYPSRSETQRPQGLAEQTRDVNAWKPHEYRRLRWNREHMPAMMTFKKKIFFFFLITGQSKTSSDRVGLRATSLGILFGVLMSELSLN